MVVYGLSGIISKNRNVSDGKFLPIYILMCFTLLKHAKTVYNTVKACYDAKTVFNTVKAF